MEQHSNGNTNLISMVHKSSLEDEQDPLNGNGHQESSFCSNSWDRFKKAGLQDLVMNSDKTEDLDPIILEPHNRNASRLSLWSRRPLMFIFGFLIVINLCLLCWASIISVRFAHDAEICIARECVIATSEMLLDRDLTADPCQDFYAYACGNYEKRNQIPQGASTIERLSEVSNWQMNSFMIPFTKALVSSNENHGAAIRIRNFVKSCLDSEARKEAGFEPLWRKINKSMPLMPNPLEEQVQNASSLEDLLALVDSFPFSIFETINNVNPTVKYESVYIVAPLELELFHRMDPASISSTSDPKIQNLIKEWEEYHHKVAAALSINSSIVEDAINFEKRMAKVMGPNVIRNQSLERQPTTLKALDANYPRFNLTHTVKRFFDNLKLSPNQRNPFSEKMKLLIIGNYRVEQQLRFFDRVLSNSSDHRSLLNWFYFKRIVYYFGKLGYQVTHILQPNQSPQSELDSIKECTQILFSQEIKKYFAPYLNYKFDAWMNISAIRPVIQSFIRNIKLEAKLLFQSMEWLDDSTRKKALEKLEAIHSNAGMPEEIATFDSFYKNLTNANVEMSELNGTFFDNLQHIAEFDQKYDAFFYNLKNEDIKRLFQAKFQSTFYITNAYYMTTWNVISINGAISQEPLFFAENAELFSYARLGSIVGHEIFHGFDYSGSNYDANGVLNNWWSEETREKYKEKQNCFVTQMDKLTYHGIKGNGNFTIQENFADNVGVSVAFSAARRLVHERQIKSNFAGLVGEEPWEKIFLTAYAQGWCRLGTEKALLQSSFGAHPIAIFRVWSVIMNNDRFGQAFQCPLGTPMNPHKKCQV